MADAVETSATLEGILQDEILKMYEEVASHPETEFHFYHGRQGAELFGYAADVLDRAPVGAVASFAGVGNPHPGASIQPGETVVDLGSGAGLDSIIAGWSTGPTGRVIGIDFNPVMRAKAESNAREAGVNAEFRHGRMEAIPVDEGTVDTLISNGVINLSFRKKHVMREIFRVLRPGGRMSIADMMSEKPLSQNIVNDPKLWAS